MLKIMKTATFLIQDALTWFIKEAFRVTRFYVQMVPGG